MSADLKSNTPEITKIIEPVEEPQATVESSEAMSVLIDGGVKILYTFNQEGQKVMQDLALLINRKRVAKKYPRARYSTFGKYWTIGGVTLYPYARTKGADQAEMFELFHKLAKLST